MNKKIIHTVFESIVNEFESKDAIVEATKSITYGNLNRFSNLVSFTLNELGVKRDSVVGVLIPSSIELVISLLGTFKSGGIYLPLDWKFPPFKLNKMLNFCTPQVLIVEAAKFEEAKRILQEVGSTTKYLLMIDNNFQLSVFNACDGIQTPVITSEKLFENPQNQVNPGDSNYIFFTSGSTGEAKGILGCHQSLGHFINWELKEFRIDKTIIVSQLTQPTFDASLRDIFLPLCSGGILQIPTAETRNNLPLLLEWIVKSKINLIHMVPSLFRLLVNELTKSERTSFPDLKFILLAGEKLYVKDILNWRNRATSDAELVNLYGATETTLIKSFYRIKELPEDPAQSIPAGKPIDNTIIAVLNDNVPCAAEEIGEIYIKTPFFSKGYYKNDALTHQVFVQNPLVSDRIDILYKTGDLGRMLKDQSLLVLGRIDDQIKINGVRAELGEIEAAVRRIPEIQEVVITSRINSVDQVELTCYFTGRDFTGEELREHLKDYLPETLTPAFFIHLDEIPLNSNGKVDKRALPKPEIPDDQPIEALDEVETKVESIFLQVLFVKKIGKNRSFFQMGGSSLKAIQIVSRIYKEFNVLLKIADIFDQPTIVGISRIIKNSLNVKFPSIERLPEQDLYDLSHAQRRLWLIDKIEEGSARYNIGGAIFIKETLQVESLEKSFFELLNRHEILRTRFSEVSGVPFQQIVRLEDLKFTLYHEDLRSHPNSKGIAQKLAEARAAIPFDLSEAPLIRAGIFQTEENEFLLFYAIHHIVSDGWSMDLIFKEVLVFYKALTQGLPNPLAPLNFHYKDYAYWQNNALNQGSLGGAQTYWISQFENGVPVLELPTDYGRSNENTSKGEWISLLISARQTNQIKEFAQTQESTLFMVLIATVNVLLYKYTRQLDIVIGTPVAGRDHPNLENQVGFYVNMIPLRIMFQEDQSFEELVDIVKRVAVKGFEHQQYPFDLLVDNLKVARDVSRSPIFDVAFVLQSEEIANPAHSAEETSINKSYLNLGTSKYELLFNIIEVAEGIYVRLEYDSELFTTERMQGMANHYQKLIESITEDFTTPLKDLDYIPDNEKAQLLSYVGETHPNLTLIQAFESKVAEAMQHTAIIAGNRRVSYEWLNERSNKVANYLKSLGIKSGDLVGLLIDRSEWMIAAMMGILKSGAGYLPLDSNYPPARLNFMISDSECKLILSENKSLWRGHLPVECSVVAIADADIFAASNPIHVNTVNDIAYVIYTSGSTGEPKGVRVTHANVINLLLNEWQPFSFDSSDVWTLFHSVCFDFSVWEIFGCLVSGGTLVVLSNDVVRDPAKLTDVLESEKVTVLSQVPGWFPYLMEEILRRPTVRLSLKYIFFGGSALHPKVLKGWKEQFDQVSLINMYGITETTVHVTYKEIGTKEIDNGLSNIGKALPSHEVYVVDSHGKLVGKGVAGEIAVGGASVAEGYLNRSSLTDKRFIKNNITGKGRLYLSGDLAIVNHEGDLIYMGRNDEQVKVRGYRVETAEIVHQILSFEGIEEATVFLRKTNSGDEVLIAYLKSEKKINHEDLRKYLKRRMPDYMLPSFFVTMDKFPVTLNGKPDLSSFPLPSINLEKNNTYHHDLSSSEHILVGLWEEVLGLKGIGPHDNFFSLGGDSLKAVRLTTRIERAFNVNIRVKDIFIFPTIHEISEVISSSIEKPYQSISSAPVDEYYELSHAQKRLWILDRLEENSIIYNIGRAFVFNGFINLGALESSFLQVIERHEILRTKFIEIDGEPRQKIYSVGESAFRLDYLDLSNVSEPEAAAREQAGKLFSTPFRLATDPLLRARIVRIAREQYVFLYSMHHIVSDGWSMELLVRELLAYYKNHILGNSPSLQPLKIQYKDYAYWQNKQLQSQNCSASRAYWLEQFQDGSPILELTSDYPRKQVRSNRGSKVSFSITKEETESLRQLGKTQGASFFMVLLGTFNALFYKYTGQEDIVIGTPVAGRDHTQLEEQIGFYINMIPLRTKFRQEENFQALLNRVKEVALNGYTHQYYPFDKLVDELELRRDMSRSPVFDVALVLQPEISQSNPVPPVSGLTVSNFNNELSIVPIDLRIFCFESSSGLNIAFEYNADLFSQDRMKRMARHYKNLINSILADVAVPVYQLAILDREEIRGLLDLNPTTLPTVNQLLHSGFESIVSNNPHSSCVIYQNKIWTYKEIDDQANNLATFLIEEFGISEDRPVGILVNRSELMVISILAVLKAGGCFLPIDPDLPPKRKEFILRDSRVDSLIIESANLHKLGLFDGNLFAVDVQLSALSAAASAPPIQIGENSLAYIIYTSGTTGFPKGAMIEHLGVTNMIENQILEFEITEKDRVLQFASLSFDASVSEIFMALSSGASLVLIDQQEVLDGFRFMNFMVENKITVVTLPPSYLNTLPWEELAQLRVLITAGEAANPKVALPLSARINYFNAYGPTECSVCVTVNKVGKKDNGKENISIGTPISNMNVVILDSNNQMVPLGVAGEIGVFGSGLFRGYLHSLQSDIDRFITIPSVNERIYKTGDIGRWMDDGSLYFVGRKDDQVKIRGFRVELGEIRSSLLRLDEVEDAAVLKNEEEIIAYIVERKNITDKELENKLSGILPYYMLPSSYLRLQEIPLNHNGKLNKEKLPTPEQLMKSAQTYLAPKNDMELKLVAIWEEVLKKEMIGVKDNFFDLGGNSLKAIQALSRIHKEMSLKLDLKTFFISPTIEDLAVEMSALNWIINPKSENAEELNIEITL